MAFYVIPANLTIKETQPDTWPKLNMIRNRKQVGLNLGLK